MGLAFLKQVIFFFFLLRENTFFDESRGSNGALWWHFSKYEDFIHLLASYPPVPPSSPWEQEHRRGIEKEMGDVSAPHWYPDLQHWQTQGSRAGVVLLTVF